MRATAHNKCLGLLALTIVWAVSAFTVIAQDGGFTAGSTVVRSGTYRLVGVVGSAIPTSGRSLIQKKEAIRQQSVDGPVRLGNVPDDFSLRANYPNPFSGQTTIRFGLPEAVEVRLTVFDLLGREVGTVVDGLRQAGIHLETFSGDRFPSGLYLYRLEAGAFNESRVMLIVR